MLFRRNLPIAARPLMRSAPKIASALPAKSEAAWLHRPNCSILRIGDLQALDGADILGTLDLQREAGDFRRVVHGLRRRSGKGEALPHKVPA